MGNLLFDVADEVARDRDGAEAAQALVCAWNREWYERTRSEEASPFAFTTDGDGWAILFEGGSIVDSETLDYTDESLSPSLARVIARNVDKELREMRPRIDMLIDEKLLDLSNVKPMPDQDPNYTFSDHRSF